MDQTNETRLGSAPLGKLLFQLGLPGVAAQVINVLYNIVDRIYIGNIPGIGDMALTGVGVTLPVYSNELYGASGTYFENLSGKMQIHQFYCLQGGSDDSSEIYGRRLL